MTIIREASGRYFASFAVDVEMQPMPKTGETIGIDFGVCRLATLSNSERIANPKRLLKRSKRLAMLQGWLTKKLKGSRRRERAKRAVWEPLALHGRKVTVLTAPLFEVSRELGPTVRQMFPDLKRIAVVRSQEDAERFRSIGVLPVIDRSVPSGLDLAALVLAELGVDSDRIGNWMRRQQKRALSGEDAAAA